MKKYIDCDGVILDTETGLFDLYYELKDKNPSLKKLHYLKQLNWKYWLSQARVLKDAIEILKNYDHKDTSILTKVHSLQEAKAKIDYFRTRGVKNDIIIVPNDVSKASVVMASGNILVDDSFNNLSDWKNNDGYPFYFGFKESEYPKIDTLDDVLNPNKIMKLR